MRKTAIAIFFIVLLWLGWSAWPFVALFDFARAARAGDVVAMERRVDYPALGRSLSRQVVQTYARLAGIPADRAVLGIAAAIADPLIARLVSRVALAQLLQKGWPTEVLGERPPEFKGVDWNALGNVWQLYKSSDYGIGEFRLNLPLDLPRAQQYRIHMTLDGLTWKLSGLDLPEPLLDRLAREVMKRKSG